jgi:type II secretory pathway component PulK
VVSAGADSPPAGASPAGARCADSGQALIFALLVLVLASIAAAFVAEDLALRERELQEEGVRMHVRALLDGGLADALARIADDRAVRRDERWGGGVTRVEAKALPGNRVRLVVRAEYAARSGEVEAIVQKSLTGPPQVVAWRRTASG